MVRDIALDEMGDLVFENGDLVITESSQQHVQDLLMTAEGGNKVAPLYGVGIVNYLNAPGTRTTQQKLKKKITLQLKADGATKVGVEVNETIKIEAQYE